MNHRGFGANADIHLDGGTQLQLQSVTDARVQLRLLEGSRIFVQSGPYPNGAEIEFAGLPVVATVRGCLGTEYTDQATLTVLCFQGTCTLSTDFGVTSEEIAAGQSVTVDVSRLEANPARPILAANALPYWNLLQRTAAGRDDARHCDVPPPPLPTPTTRSDSGARARPLPRTRLYRHPPTRLSPIRQCRHRRRPPLSHRQPTAARRSSPAPPAAADTRNKQRAKHPPLGCFALAALRDAGASRRLAPGFHPIRLKVNRTRPT